uniref:Uncharacterized protein n=1 Tax=Acrobeloides nanus TaxID=290746 RepID=A0A914DHP7_9BILA
MGFNVNMLEVSPAIISVTGCNFAGKCATSNQLTIETPTENAQYSVQILGIPDNPLPSLRISMMSNSEFVLCNSSQDDTTLINITV